MIDNRIIISLASVLVSAVAVKYLFRCSKNNTLNEAQERIKNKRKILYEKRSWY